MSKSEGLHTLVLCILTRCGEENDLELSFILRPVHTKEVSGVQHPRGILNRDFLEHIMRPAKQSIERLVLCTNGEFAQTSDFIGLGDGDRREEGFISSPGEGEVSAAPEHFAVVDLHSSDDKSTKQRNEPCGDPCLSNPYRMKPFQSQISLVSARREHPGTYMAVEEVRTKHIVDYYH
jgi:hypothetical protein